MKKFLLALLTSLFLLSGTAFAEIAIDKIQAELVNEVSTQGTVVQTEEEKAVAEIKRIGERLRASFNHEVQLYMIGDGISTCTGVLLKNDETGADILTAKHCSAFGTELYAEGVLITAIQVSTKNDLALWKTARAIPNKTSAPLASRNSHLGEELYGVGKPIVDPFPLYGKVNLITMNNDYALMASIPGTSGAGLFNENMEIAGILWGGIESMGLTVYTNVSRIETFLKEINYIQDVN